MVNCTIQSNPVQVIVTRDPMAVQVITGIQGPPGGGGSDFSWLLISSDFTMQAGIAYIVQADSLVTLRLPESATRGDRLVVYRSGNSNWRVSFGEGQTVKFGNVTATPGTGSLESLEDGDFIFLVALDTNIWLVYGSQGHIEVR